jgi:hypothetical protein
MKPVEPVDLAQFGYEEGQTYEFTESRADAIERIIGEAVAQSYSAKKPEDVFARNITRAIMFILAELPKELIRAENGVYSYDLVKDSLKARGALEYATTIKQTLAYIHNGADSFFALKCKRKIFFKDGPVDVSEYKRVEASCFKYDDVTITEGGLSATINLTNLLLSCKKSITYDSADVIPHSPREKLVLGDVFNMFGSYQHTFDPNFVVDTSITDKWVNHVRVVLGCKDNALGEYLLNWFAHLLQKPETKTEVVPLIKGISRCGKNLPFNIFQRYVLNPSLTVTCADIEKVFGRFNSLQMGKLLIVLDETLDSRDRQMAQRMKNAITEETNQIENKGKNVIEVQSFSNFAILTNNDFASIIEQNDARYLCIEANGEMRGNRAYFQDLVDTCSNTKAGEHLFHWLMARDLSNFVPSDFPETTYKKQLKVKQSCTVIRWLLTVYTNLCEAGDESEFKHTPSVWYKEYQAWCVESGEKKTLALNPFLSIMGNNGFPTLTTTEKHPVSGKRSTCRYRALSQALIKKNLDQYILPEGADEIEP